MEENNNNDISSDESYEISDCELETYEFKSKSYPLSIQPNLDSPHHEFRRLLSMPILRGKKKQSFKHKGLLQHATGICASISKKCTQRATHLTLARFLTTDISESGSVPVKTEPKLEPKPVKNDDAELFVWPWTGILDNVPLGEKLEERFSKLKPLEVIPLFVKETGSCVVIMRFNKDWSGFKDVMAFENQFKAMKLGREEFVKGKFEIGKVDIYGWMGREEDFKGDDAVGEYLKRNGKLLTVLEVEREMSRENGKIVALLASQIEAKNQHLLDLERRFNLRDLSLKRILEYKNKLRLAFNESLLDLEMIKD